MSESAAGGVWRESNNFRRPVDESEHQRKVFAKTPKSTSAGRTVHRADGDDGG